MKINGNLVFNTDGTGELRNVYVERLASAPVSGNYDGRIYYNTNTKILNYFDSTTWVPLSTGGDATALQTEVDAIETSIGPAVTTAGVFNVAAFAASNELAGATSLTNALMLLDAAVAGADELSELNDVTLTVPANGQFLKFNGTNWVNSEVNVANIADLTATAAELNVLDGITTTTTELNYVAGVTSPVQTQLNALQPGDPTLAALALLDETAGILVQTAVDAFAKRTLQVSGAGLSIQYPDGIGGDPTFSLTADVAAYEGLATTGYVIRTGDGTATTRSIVGTVGRVTVLNGNGVTSDTSIDLDTVSQAATGDFVKVTLDTFGRVTGNTAVVQADITSLVDSVYVNVSGDTLTGNLNFGGTATVTGLTAPTVASDAATKAYVDNLVAGLTWETPVLGLVANAGALPGTPALNDRYYQTDINSIVTWDGVSWVAEIIVEGAAFFDKSSETGYVGDGTGVVQFTGGGQITAGLGLLKTGNVIDINFGAGIAELPSDEVGIHLFDSAASALILTTDGSNRGDTAGHMLHLLLEAGGGLAQTANGLKINTSSVTNAMLVNQGLTLNGDTGTDALNLGDTLQVIGNATQGTSVAVSESPVGTSTFTVTVANAAYAQKGVASFDSDDFIVTNGAVELNTIQNGALANSSFTMAGNAGTPQVISLGDTFTVLDAGTHADAGVLVKTTASTGDQLQIGIREATATLAGVASFASADFSVTAGAVTLVGKNLDSLTDVAVTGAAAGNVLVSNGTNFVNRNVYFLYDGATPATSHTVTHNLNQKYCNVTVVDSADQVIIPESITFNTANQLTVTFTSSTACKVVVMGV